MQQAKSTFWLEGPSFLKDVEISGPSVPSGREETKVEDVEKTVAQTYIVQRTVIDDGLLRMDGRLRLADELF
jgi:hypothetical protein